MDVTCGTQNGGEMFHYRSGMAVTNHVGFFSVRREHD